MKFVQTRMRRADFFGWLVVALLGIYIVAGAAFVPFHGDEATQIYMSRDYAAHFLEGNPSRLVVADPPPSAQQQALRLVNGSINQYSIGLAWHLAGYTVTSLNEQWDWGADFDYNVRMGHAPSDDLLRVARLPSALFTALSLIPLFALGRRLARPFPARLAFILPFLTVGLFALNPAVLLNGRRAMMEGSLLFFSLMTVWAGTLLLDNLTPRPPPQFGEGEDVSPSTGSLQEQKAQNVRLSFSRSATQWRGGRGVRLFSGAAVRLFCVIFPGVASGLAMSAKHTALFPVAAVFIALGGAAIYWGVRGRRRAACWALVALLIAGVIAFGVFYALNPVWWEQSPLAMAGRVLQLRTDLLTGQTAAFGGYPDFGAALGGFFRQTFMVLPQYYEVAGWETFIGEQIADYESSFWRGISPGHPATGVILLAATVLGGVSIMRSAHTSANFLIPVYAVVMVGAALLTPIEWQRYYLGMYPVIALLAPLGLGWAIQGIRRVF